MKTMLKYASICAFALVGGATAQSAERWDMASSFQDGNFHTQNLRWFADEVAEATGNQLQITVHSGASLFPADEILTATQTRQIPIGEICLCHYGNEDPLFEADGLPFYAQGYDQAEKLWEISRPMIEERLEQRGLVVLYAVPWPGQGFYTRDPIGDISDFEGVRMRSDYPPLTRLAELLGAEPVTVRAAEVPTAFGTGMIQAMYTSPSTGVNTQAWDFVDYYYDLRANHPKNVVIVNRDALDALDETSRQAVLEVARRAEERGWDLSRQKTEEDLQTLIDNGVEVASFDDDTLQRIRDLAAEVSADWLQRINPEDREALRPLTE